MTEYVTFSTHVIDIKIKKHKKTERCINKRRISEKKKKCALKYCAYRFVVQSLYSIMYHYNKKEKTNTAFHILMTLQCLGYYFGI